MTRAIARILIALVVVLASGASVSVSKITAPAETPELFARAISDPPWNALREKRAAQHLPDWPGGAITTSTGETVTVFVSPSLGSSVTPQQWAEFIAHLIHGPEISLLKAFIGTLDDVQQICETPDALGCYGNNILVAPGQLTVDGVSPEEIVRHEYGHHVAFNRLNPPWVAIDWGPKNWASAEGVCQRVNRSSAFPGDEGVHYRENPGEAWAETYRLMDERKNGILTQSWKIVSPSFFPTEAAYTAAEQDVLQPWTAARTTTYRKRFTRKGKKGWFIPLKTPLDGSLTVSALLPKGASDDVALLSSNAKTVLNHAALGRARTKRLTATVCGQRSLYVRVMAKGALRPRFRQRDDSVRSERARAPGLVEPSRLEALTQ